jgi:hypothetical protein
VSEGVRRLQLDHWYRIGTQHLDGVRIDGIAGRVVFHPDLDIVKRWYQPKVQDTFDDHRVTSVDPRPHPVAASSTGHRRLFIAESGNPGPA